MLLASVFKYLTNIFKRSNKLGEVSKPLGNVYIFKVNSIGIHPKISALKLVRYEYSHCSQPDILSFRQKELEVKNTFPLSFIAFDVVSGCVVDEAEYIEFDYSKWLIVSNLVCGYNEILYIIRCDSSVEIVEVFLDSNTIIRDTITSIELLYGFDSKSIVSCLDTVKVFR